MGIALPTTPGARSTVVSATYTAIALVFFFGVGLAGGTAYKLLYADQPDQQVADEAAPPSAATPDNTPQPAPQTAFAPPTADSAPSPASRAAAPQLARLAPSAPPSVPPPPDATVTPSPSDSTSSNSAAPTAPAPYASVAPQAPAASAAAAPAHVVGERHAAVPPRKPVRVAKSAHLGPSVALHTPPAAPGDATGPFRVQFGAFANEDNARRVQWAIEATGLKVEVTQAPGSSGQELYYLRSPDYHDYAAALSAAQTVRDRVQHFVNAIPIDYAIMGDHSALEQQAEAR